MQAMHHCTYVDCVIQAVWRVGLCHDGSCVEQQLAADWPGVWRQSGARPQLTCCRQMVLPLAHCAGIDARCQSVRAVLLLAAAAAAVARSNNCCAMPGLDRSASVKHQLSSSASSSSNDLKQFDLLVGFFICILRPIYNARLR
jgi:hypothetical protein